MQIQSVTPDQDGMRLDRFLKLYVPNLPYGLMQKHLRRGIIRIDGAKAKSDARLEAGQEVRFPEYDDIDASAAPSQSKRLSDSDRKFIQQRVLYENDAVIAINKPAGLAVQGGSKIKECVEDYTPALQGAYDDPPRLVHRLDKDTSGVLLLARTRSAAQELTAAFKQKTTQKTYLAITAGVPEHPQGTIKAPLIKRLMSGEEKMAVVGEGEKGEYAETDYEVLDTLGEGAALLRLSPITGRTHQLRVHCQLMGCPILGDPKYDGQSELIEDMGLANQLHLHAQRIAIEAMAIDIEAPLPKHMKHTIHQLGFVL